MNEGIVGFFALLSVPAIMWFYSYHPRLFIRTFVPRDELRAAIPGILRDPNFGRGMALLQFGVAVVIGVIGSWLKFR